MNLINDLSKSYGKDKAFRDDELFDKIASLTYPEIKTFFTNYVSGSKPLPYKEVLAYVGVDYNKVVSNKGFSFGQFDLGFNPNTYRMLIAGTTNLNNFGKTMGYQMGDEIVKINGKKVNAKNFRDFVAQWKSKVKEGDKLTIEVLRQSNSGKAHKVKLSHKVFMGDVRKYNIITFIEKPTEAQQKIKDAWLKSN
jgi:predicted metalloprotease with PDZ domain